MAIAAAVVATLFLTIAPAQGDVYAGAATVVYKEQGQAPKADDGAVVCAAGGLGAGGGCIPFTAGPAIAVNDVVSGTDVAFQVCIDNNGDGICTSGGEQAFAPCADDVRFSHDDQNNFYNPLGVPSGFRPTCPGNANPGVFNGYVVFICEGVHVVRNGTSNGGDPHTHPAIAGTISGSTNPDPGKGDFCGGQSEPVSKPYYLVP